MKPEDLLGVFVRAAGLYLLGLAIVSLVALIPAITVSPIVVVAIPFVEGFVGLLIIWSADQIVRFCYR